MAKRPPPAPPAWHRELVSHGVTGTNGKTSTVGLLAAALAAPNAPVPSITTLGAFIDDAPFEAPSTHDGLLAALAEGLKRGAKHSVLELTSEALALGYARAWPCWGALFTNLSHDHLDAHQSLEHYLASKAQLFMALPAGGYAVLNGCDAACQLLAEVLPPNVRTLHYGVASRGAAHTTLDVEGFEVEIGWRGSSCKLRGTLPGLPERLSVRAIGSEHLENALAALCGAVLSGVAAEQAARAIERAAPRPGRFEVFGGGPYAVVDFAHSPDALSRVVRTARALCAGKLWVVFGAGGKRDREKRPAMGEAAREADHIVLTTDNCRDEEARDICQDIAGGLIGHASVTLELDRERAIRSTISAAAPGDVVLIAGRGPERGLDLGTQRVTLVDADVVQAALAER